MSVHDESVARRRAGCQRLAWRDGWAGGSRTSCCGFRTRDGDETTVYLTRHPLARTRVSLAAASRSRRGSTTGAPPRASRGDRRGVLRARPVPAARRGPARRRGRGARAGGGAVGRAAGVRSRRRGGTDRAARRAPPTRGGPRPGRPAARPRRPLGDRRRRTPRASRPGAAQFDSDITVGRYPRCALGVSDDELLAVCCDGRRSGVDAGLELGGAGAAADLVRRARGDQPRRRRVGDARPPRPPAQPPLLEPTTSRRPSRGRSSPRYCWTRLDLSFPARKASSLALVVARAAARRGDPSAYAWRALYDTDQFANRATAALQDRACARRSPTGHRRAGDPARPELLAARPLIASVVSGAVGGDAFASLFRRVRARRPRRDVPARPGTLTLTLVGRRDRRGRRAAPARPPSPPPSRRTSASRCSAATSAP